MVLLTSIVSKARGGGEGGLELINVKHNTNLSVNTPLLVHLLYSFPGPAKLSVACSSFSFVGGESGVN